jgi:hypothetical protein
VTWHGRVAYYAWVVAMDDALVRFAEAMAPALPTTRLRQSHATGHWHPAPPCEDPVTPSNRQTRIGRF